MNITLIYALTDKNGAVRYIGKTISTLQRRLVGHLSHARRGQKNYRCDWIRSMLAEGQKPEIQILESDCKDGNKSEREWIALFRKRGARLTNGTDGGDGASPGHSVSKEARLKISLASMGNKKFLGRKHTPETIAKMRAAKIGSPLSENHKRNMSAAITGSKHSRPRTLEQRIAMSIATKGRVHSMEHRRKISETLKRKFVDKAKAEKKSILATIVGERPASVPADIGVFVVENGKVK